jgi:hypothetical protein
MALSCVWSIDRIGSQCNFLKVAFFSGLGDCFVEDDISSCTSKELETLCSAMQKKKKCKKQRDCMQTLSNQQLTDFCTLHPTLLMVARFKDWLNIPVIGLVTALPFTLVRESKNSVGVVIIHRVAPLFCCHLPHFLTPSGGNPKYPIHLLAVWHIVISSQLCSPYIM